MLQLFTSIVATSKVGMGQLEETVTGLLGGEKGKCAFVRSEAFVRLRIQALYRRDLDRPMSAETDGLKVTLTPDGTALVYIACPDAPKTDETTDSELGKRRERPDEDVWAAV
jgi:hypothetical protein